MGMNMQSGAVASNLGYWLRQEMRFFERPIHILRGYKRENLRPDIVAGLTVAVVMLPQAIAYALVAELPPQVGLYGAIVMAIVGALWGSSFHLHTGPTNAISLLVIASLATTVEPGSPEFIAAAGLMAVMVGFTQLVMGLARLGVLINFVSDSVIIGFTAGAGILISFTQLQHLLRIQLPRTHMFSERVAETFGHLTETHMITFMLGLGTIVIIAVVKHFRPRWPSALIGMLAASGAVAAFNLSDQGVIVLGELPRTLPPLADLPLFDIGLMGRVSTGALAIAAIGLVEAMSISRSIAAQTGQRLDSNQEFAGQGLANIASGLFSGYTGSGSFTRSAVNYSAGARSPLASVFSGLWVLLAMLLFAPLAAYLPRAALAGVLLVTAYGMVDRKEIRRIWRTSRGDSLIMIGTFLGTLLLELEFAVLAGVLISFGRFIVKTSTPVVQTVLPDDNFRHFIHRPDKPACPQLSVIQINGVLYFGAAQYVEDVIRANLEQNSNQRYLMLRMHSVDHCDVSGIRMLESVVRLYRRMSGDVFFVGVNDEVKESMRLSGFDSLIGADHILDRDTGALSHLFYRKLDPAICIYECEVRAWKECQNLPKRIMPSEIVLRTEAPSTKVNLISPHDLRKKIKDGNPVRVIDVREPREFEKGHIPEAELLPLLNLLGDENQLPPDCEVVFVCRSGRRGSRAAQYATGHCREKVYFLKGGMVAWEDAGFLDAVDK